MREYRKLENHSFSFAEVEASLGRLAWLPQSESGRWARPKSPPSSALTWVSGNFEVCGFKPAMCPEYEPCVNSHAVNITWETYSGQRRKVPEEGGTWLWSRWPQQNPLEEVERELFPPWHDWHEGIHREGNMTHDRNWKTSRASWGHGATGRELAAQTWGHKSILGLSW